MLVHCSHGLILRVGLQLVQGEAAIDADRSPRSVCSGVQSSQPCRMALLSLAGSRGSPMRQLSIITASAGSCRDAIGIHLQSRR